MTQLDLFDVRPGGRVYIFPFARRHALVARAARALMQKAGKRRQDYWDGVVAGIMGEIDRAGGDRDEQRAHVRAFRDAVLVEMEGSEIRTFK